jgi:hypothetical protein
VAAALTRRAGVYVQLFAGNPEIAASAAGLMRRLGAASHELRVLQLPAWLEGLGRSDFIASPLKLPRLLRYLRTLRGCSVLVTAERTSSVLKRLPGRCPPMVHLRHGVGDRAVGFEQRIARFDQLLVAGEKDRQRTLAAGLLAPEQVHAIGPVKLSTIRQLRPGSPRLFDNDRPVVLYNPHFNARLSSWAGMGREVIERIRASRQFNLVVAPHVRLLAGADSAEVERWRSLQIPGELLFDPGSERSVDMTYTLGADIYLGDVSSQVYEFAVEPRPCVFLNSHAAAWRDNPDYLMWRMGEVVDSAADVVGALQRAAASHAGFLQAQRDLVAAAVGEISADSAERAADIILHCAR